MKNPYMKFQNPSMHGSEVMQCIKKRNRRTDGWTDARTNVLEVGGIMSIHNICFYKEEDSKGL